MAQTSWRPLCHRKTGERETRHEQAWSHAILLPVLLSCILHSLKGLEMPSPFIISRSTSPPLKVQQAQTIFELYPLLYLHRISQLPSRNGEIGRRFCLPITRREENTSECERSVSQFTFLLSFSLF